MNESRDIYLNKINALEIFHIYLYLSMNWAYRFLILFKKTNVKIGSDRFIKNNFFTNKFEYYEFPFKTIDNDTNNPIIKIFNFFINRILTFYPLYLIQILKKRNINIIHSHFANTGWRYNIISKKLKIPHVISFYGYDYENLPFRQPIWNSRYKILFNEADHFICEGKHAASILESKGCPKEKISIVHLGIDANNIPVYERLKTEKLNLLQMATLTSKKGQKYTIKAFSKALKKCPNMTLTIVGKDPYNIRENLINLTKKEEVYDKVIFIDSIEYSMLYEYMKDFEVFIHPSNYTRTRDCEGGAPVVFLDAQATGMPVISTFHCDIPDEVIHEKTGILVQEKNILELSKAIERFYFMKQEEYNQFSSHARRHIELNYDIKETASLIEEIYEKLIFSTEKK